MNAFAEFQLAGSYIDALPMKHCFKCDQDKPQAGGIDVGPNKFKCVDCFRRKLFSVQAKKTNAIMATRKKK